MREGVSVPPRSANSVGPVAGPRLMVFCYPRKGVVCEKSLLIKEASSLQGKEGTQVPGSWQLGQRARV